ncbi:MAG TPA: 3-oxoacyl-[acyl-carrier-protein] synthase III C-terminal domain-containing protein [Solirubrobacteraceae bacterium]|nr:3-oxoacyl-[acyl-carrier-protein] synthase III C-terminal domain-containing protein [Solirubrobacteraceae bacterium]
MNAIDVRAVPTAVAERSRQRSGPRIAGLTVSDSAETLTQRQVLDRLGLTGDEFAERIFAHSRIERRHLNLSEDLLARTSQGRAQEVEDELLGHSVRAVAALGGDLGRIGSVLSASLYSLGLPTLAHRLAEHFELDPTADKYHVTGVGCASAVPLMRLAAGALHLHHGRDSLIVAAESMSSIMMPSTGADPRAKTVGSAIFGDGCAAALLSDDPSAGGPMILASQVHQIGGTLGAVALSFAPEDSYLHLARELPELAGAGLPGVVAGFLSANELEHADIDHWIVHPGGRRIIENIQRALELSDAQIELAWDTLASHGNVGTPSIFYVLHDTIARRDPQPGERGLAVTIGPGVTVGLMLLQW